MGLCRTALILNKFIAGRLPPPDVPATFIQRKKINVRSGETIMKRVGAAQRGPGAATPLVRHEVDTKDRVTIRRLGDPEIYRFFGGEKGFLRRAFVPVEKRVKKRASEAEESWLE